MCNQAARCKGSVQADPVGGLMLQWDGRYSWDTSTISGIWEGATHAPLLLNTWPQRGRSMDNPLQSAREPTIDPLRNAENARNTQGRTHRAKSAETTPASLALGLMHQITISPPAHPTPLLTPRALEPFLPALLHSLAEGTENTSCHYTRQRQWLQELGCKRTVLSSLLLVEVGDAVDLLSCQTLLGKALTNNDASEVNVHPKNNKRSADLNNSCSRSIAQDQIYTHTHHTSVEQFI